MRTAEPAAKQETEPAIEQGTETILLVEDDGPVRELAREILEMNGYTVVEAADGMEALKIFERESEIDLMITDLVMPRLGGRELARKIAAKSPKALRLAKWSLNGIELLDVKESYRYEQGFTLELYTSPDSQEARDAFVEKRDADFEKKAGG